MIDRSQFAALLEPRRPLRAIAVGWLATSIPSLALAAILSWLIPQASQPPLPTDGMLALVALVIVAPLLETLIMATAIEIGLLLLPPIAVVGLSAVGWGIAHSLKAPIWGLVIWWPFLIFSTLYVTWRGEGRLKAFAIAASVHALNNLLPALLLLRSP